LVAETIHGPGFDYPQELGLQRKGKFSDLVKKQGPAVGKLQAAAFSRESPGERAALMSEKLAFEQRVDETGAVDRHKRTVGAAAIPVNRMRDQFLPRSRFPDQQHSSVGSRHAGNLPAQLTLRDTLAQRPGIDSQRVLHALAFFPEKTGVSESVNSTLRVNHSIE
jgi:hypothetical protein